MTPLAQATTAHVEAERALGAAMRNTTVTMDEIRPLWDAAQAARRRYAEELTAAGHAVPAGLVAA